jgi:hypothetical protein
VSVRMPLVTTSVFDLNESPVFKRVPEGAKSTESSSKSSSTERASRWFSGRPLGPVEQVFPYSCHA